MHSLFPRWCRSWLALVLWFGGVAWVHAAVDPVTFVFRLPEDARNPFARDLWAEVETPAHQTLRLPVFFYGEDQFAVRARADAAGEYRLGAVTERREGRTLTLKAKVVGKARQKVNDPETLRPVKCVPGHPPRLAYADGQTYAPIGANLAWASDRLPGHLRMLREFGRAGLNWSRIWMVHWSDLNLDWLPKDQGASPKIGTLDLRVARNWDQLIREAEESGVYLQVVLQHHGQYTSGTDSSWREHPWNAANGGFLQTPSDFFTSAEARRLTAMKYRYIVARWGYSPAVLAWELFNEVHWTDPMREQHNEAPVAEWHAAMAAQLRAVDTVYRHPVTTSTDNLRSAIYTAMDYYQPHLYATNILANARRFDVPPATVDRPMFYGEIGDDHLRLSAEEKATGIQIVPPVWASLMGQGRYAAMPWLGEQLCAAGRIDELGAVARFIAAGQLGGREGLQCFSPAITDAPQVPFVLSAGQMWQRRPGADLTLAMDGRELLEYADIPRIFIGWPNAVAEGYPNKTTVRGDFPRETTVRVLIADVGADRGQASVSLDGQKVADYAWTKRPEGETATPRPMELSLPVGAGLHTLRLENSGQAEWFDLKGIDLGLTMPALAAIGQRNEQFMALWVWSRPGVFAPTVPAPITGILQLEQVPAGTWRVTWWDTVKGVPDVARTIIHSGGTLPLETPGIARHAAVLLERLR